MNNKILSLLVLSTFALCGCTQQMTLSGQDQNLVQTGVTQQENAVVFPDDNPSIPDGKVVWDRMNCSQCHTGAGPGVEGDKETMISSSAGGAASGGTSASSTTASSTSAAAPAANGSPDIGEIGGEKRGGGSAGAGTGNMTATGGDVPSGAALPMTAFKKDLSDKKMAAQITPLDQYMFLTYGRQGSKHVPLKDKLSRREIWDLVFYSRAIATPMLNDDDWGKLDPVFGSNCAVCHGKKGYGDGPLARNLEPVPANFHQFNRFYDRTDNQVYDHIAYGIRWTGMPNFLGKTDSKKNVKFDQAYITTLVQYIRAFHCSNKPTNVGKTTAGGNQASPPS